MPAAASWYLRYNHEALYEGASSTRRTLTPGGFGHELRGAAGDYTESTSATIAYNTWFGITQPTGDNGQQLLTSYDTSGRPSTATSPQGATRLAMKQTAAGRTGYAHDAGRVGAGDCTAPARQLF